MIYHAFNTNLLKIYWCWTYVRVFTYPFLFFPYFWLNLSTLYYYIVCHFDHCWWIYIYDVNPLSNKYVINISHRILFAFSFIYGCFCLSKLIFFFMLSPYIMLQNILIHIKCMSTYICRNTGFFLLYFVEIFVHIYLIYPSSGT